MQSLPHTGRLVPASAVACAAVLGAAMTAAPNASAREFPNLRVESVEVTAPNTVVTTFTNPLDPAMVTAMRFAAPHLNADLPHFHQATSIVLSNGQRTVTATLDRGLHTEADMLDWTITEVTDIHGQTLTDHHWEVWATGSER